MLPFLKFKDPPIEKVESTHVFSVNGSECIHITRDQWGSPAGVTVAAGCHNVVIGYNVGGYYS